MWGALEVNNTVPQDQWSSDKSVSRETVGELVEVDKPLTVGESSPS